MALLKYCAVGPIHSGSSVDFEVCSGCAVLSPGWPDTWLQPNWCNLFAPHLLPWEANHRAAHLHIDRLSPVGVGWGPWLICKVILDTMVFSPWQLIRIWDIVARGHPPLGSLQNETNWDISSAQLDQYDSAPNIHWTPQSRRIQSNGTFPELPLYSSWSHLAVQHLAVSNQTDSATNGVCSVPRSPNFCHPDLY